MSNKPVYSTCRWPLIFFDDRVNPTSQHNTWPHHFFCISRNPHVDAEINPAPMSLRFFKGQHEKCEIWHFRRVCEKNQSNKNYRNPRKMQWGGAGGEHKNNKCPKCDRAAMRVNIPPFIELGRPGGFCTCCQGHLVSSSTIDYELSECRACNLGVFSQSCDCVRRRVAVDRVSCERCDTCPCGNRGTDVHTIIPLQGPHLYFKCCKTCFTTCLTESRDRDREVEKSRFNELWSNADPCQKLGFYGVKKLRHLAKSKSLPRHYLLTKSELLEALGPLVSGLDFPIK